ncbi:MAG: hypothetical protein LBB17_00840 [Puniceicoccales bacterium]|jgi:hypothetical protein|nr:hypothetical protein [Puniceicoccales bacterium]
MNILKLFQHLKSRREIDMNDAINAKSQNLCPTGSGSKSGLQIQPTKVTPSIPQYVNDIELNVLLGVANRSKNHTSGDGHNNCGFNAILEQVGDRTHTHEMINLLRRRLGYGDENSNKMFDTNSCLSVANLFKRPVIEICHNGGKLEQLSFSIPGVDDLSIHLRKDEQLSQNFIQQCRNFEWPQERIDILSQWLETNAPGTVNFNKATSYDIALQLLQCPTAITLISIDRGGHFDAAPHKHLRQEASVLELLCGEKN